MKLAPIDLTILAGFFMLVIGTGLYFSRNARRSMSDYFISHRSMPWWLAGTAMVATTFSADTPLAVTEMVTRHGVAGNWLWWSMLASGMLTVFFFAKLWRRAEVVTDVELAELRYSGRPAAFLRGFRAAYLGLVVNIIIMGWVNLGMAKILEGTLGVSKWNALLVCMTVTFLYTVVSGYWGVAATDGIQYLFEMGGAILLAVLAMKAVGGVEALKSGLGSIRPANAPPDVTFGSAAEVLSFFPTGSGAWVVPTVTLAALLGFNWWASWYPGSEPGGGGYVVQNLLACKTERDSRLAALLFNIAHYAIRSWPWVVTALCTLILYDGVVQTNGIDDPGANYVRAMVDLLPTGLRGFMLASFAAAYMSTQATQMNWGASYLTNDLYRRFIRRDAPEAHYVFAARIATAFTLALSIVATLFMDQVSRAWEFLLMLGAGTGLVYILRWYWWRINAWSEVAAMSSALVVSLGLRFAGAAVPAFDTSRPEGFALVLITTTLVTTLVWISVTFLTSAEPMEKLEAFYRKVRPAGPGWGPIASSTGLEPRPGEIGRNLLYWVLAIVFVYSIMFATGAVIFEMRRETIVYSTLLLVSGFLLFAGMWREPEASDEL